MSDTRGLRKIARLYGLSATRDVEWYGTVVPKGSRMLLLTASANRGEREFRDPDRFDVERPISTALGFG
jgi:cytochrome P450